MFIRVTQVKVNPGQWAAFLDTFEKVTIPLLEVHAGFMRVICSGDEASTTANLITMWQKSDQGGGVGLKGRDVAMETLQDYLSEEPVSSGFDEILEREF